MGLPGSGKTTLAELLVEKLNAVWFNADEIRKNINDDLGFSKEDRIKQSFRMGWLCDQVVKTNNYAIADFVCPTNETREAFGQAFIIWINRIEKGRYEDTNELFQPPKHFDIKLDMGSPEEWLDKVIKLI